MHGVQSVQDERNEASHGDLGTYISTYNVHVCIHCGLCITVL